MGIASIIIGVVAIVVGVAVYVMVHNELADQHITVSEDAPFLGGDEVDGPFSAYAQAEAINDHATEAGGGKTYAELAQDDPARQTVMTADFLQASLFTSVVAFGVAALVVVLGLIIMALGWALRRLARA
jgi:ABC-type sugar transport system permease subunit